MWPLRKAQGSDVCEGDVRSWMDRCVRAFGGGPIRWGKLSSARQLVREKREDDLMIDAIVEEISRALASPTSTMS